MSDNLSIVNASFWHGKSVFITGHNGFTGRWLCRALEEMGAVVTGYSLPDDNICDSARLVK
jgi:CDP-glucose 4,6-dehydratase